ncbi:MAG: hypothetical protein ABT20_07265 [Rubrivivax sp. SCN 70-15]|nr:MAG: hypothetical protein ABT20_07265 [Rubrivivax sp. SCN 70-15]
MNGGTTILWFAAMTLALLAASLGGFERRQRRYRGWPWWMTALWLAAAGAALAAAVPAAYRVSELLLLQWPIVTLVGLRRFDSRLGLPLNERSDWAVLAAAGLLAASHPLWPADGVTGALVPDMAALLVHLYAAALFFCGPPGRDAFPLNLLGLTMAMVALAPLPAGWIGHDPIASIGLRTIATALGAVVMAFVAITLASERTERQLRESQRRLRALANIDALTQVPNRRHFHELADLALRADAPGSATLLMFDVDHFKRINDALGHAAGDRVLRLVSGSILDSLRPHDVAGRHGGDEFVLLLRHTGIDDAMGVAGRIVGRLQLQAEGVALPPLSLSFGIVQLLPGEAVDDALRRADQALYEAKRQGRSCAVAARGDEDQPVFSESQRLGLTAC